MGWRGFACAYCSIGFLLCNGTEIDESFVRCAYLIFYHRPQDVSETWIECQFEPSEKTMDENIPTCILERRVVGGGDQVNRAVILFCKRHVSNSVSASAIISFWIRHCQTGTDGVRTR